MRKALHSDAEVLSASRGKKGCMFRVLERDIYFVVLTFTPNFFPQRLGYVPRQTSAAAAANPFASSTLYSSPRK